MRGRRPVVARRLGLQRRIRRGPSIWLRRHRSLYWLVALGLARDGHTVATTAAKAESASAAWGEAGVGSSFAATSMPATSSPATTSSARHGRSGSSPGRGLGAARVRKAGPWCHPSSPAERSWRHGSRRTACGVCHAGAHRTAAPRRPDRPGRRAAHRRRPRRPGRRGRRARHEQTSGEASARPFVLAANVVVGPPTSAPSRCGPGRRRATRRVGHRDQLGGACASLELTAGAPSGGRVSTRVSRGPS